MKKGVHIRKGKRGWLWNLVGANGKIVAHGEEFATRGNAVRSFKATVSLIGLWNSGQLLMFKEFPLPKKKITRQ